MTDGSADSATPPTEPQPEAPAQPLFLIKGDATPEEVAALTAVLASMSAAAPESRPQPRASQWAARQRAVRSPSFAAPGAWRASALPR